MGLDMSLRMKRRPKRGRVKSGIRLLYREYYNKDELIDFKLPDLTTDKIDYNYTLSKKATRIEDTYELAYWRKSNAIHKWFVDNVQYGNDDCGSYIVTQEDLTRLLDLVYDVLDNCKLKNGTVKNGYTVKKVCGRLVKKYIKEKGKVLSRKSIRYCKKKLPTQKGFFFGSTDYNEYYYNDLVYTKERLEYILSNFSLSEDNIYYTSSW